MVKERVHLTHHIHAAAAAAKIQNHPIVHRVRCSHLLCVYFIVHCFNLHNLAFDVCLWLASHDGTTQLVPGRKLFLHLNVPQNSQHQN